MDDREIPTQKICRDFDRLASYETDGWNHNNHYHDCFLKQLSYRCDRVLDLGCGTSEFSRSLAKRTERVLAIDLSPNSIALTLPPLNQSSV
jgi:2-polyprenyl-3-methyl-5-hydroxy-6-metoxy-1,4-benzoquinol methylase